MAPDTDAAITAAMDERRRMDATAPVLRPLLAQLADQVMAADPDTLPPVIRETRTRIAEAMQPWTGSTSVSTP